MNRILNVITYVLAAIYFVVDAVFMAVARPVSDWIARHVALRKLQAWIRSLPPYSSLALFSVPVIILEPVKPHVRTVLEDFDIDVVGEIFDVEDALVVDGHFLDDFQLGKP